MYSHKVVVDTTLPLAFYVYGLSRVWFMVCLINPQRVTVVAFSVCFSLSVCLTDLVTALSNRHHTTGGDG